MLAAPRRRGMGLMRESRLGGVGSGEGGGAE